MARLREGRCDVEPHRSSSRHTNQPSRGLGIIEQNTTQHSATRTRTEHTIRIPTQSDPIQSTLNPDHPRPNQISFFPNNHLNQEPTCARRRCPNPCPDTSPFPRLALQSELHRVSMIHDNHEIKPLCSCCYFWLSHSRHTGLLFCSVLFLL